MKFVPYYQLDGVPNIAVDGNAHKDSKLILSHWIHSGTNQEWMRDTSAQIVLDFLQRGNSIPEKVDAVSNDHFDQDGLVGVFALIEPEFALKHYDTLVDVATSGDFGKYSSRNSARISMALAKMVHPSGQMITKDIFEKPYPEMAAAFYQLGIEMLPKLICDLNKFKHLWEEEDQFLTKCEQNLANGKIVIEEITDYDLAIIIIPNDLQEEKFHRFTVIRKGPVHDMALHNATKMGRIIYSYAGQLYFKYRYETWVQLEDNHHPLRVNLEKVASNLSKMDNSIWKYQGSDKLVPLLEKTDKGPTSVQSDDFKNLLINAFESETVDWNPYI